MGEIINFVRHKTAGWAGVIYLDKKGQKRVNNGCFDWPLTQEREEKLSVIEKNSDGVKNFLDRLGMSCVCLFRPRLLFVTSTESRMFSWNIAGNMRMRHIFAI